MTDAPQTPDGAGRTPDGSASDGTGWMHLIDALSDAELDALLHGDVGPDQGDLAPVAEVVRALRARAAAEPVPPMSEALVAQLHATSAAGGGAATPLAPRRSRRMQTAAAAVVAAAALSGIGVAAAQNRLPAAVQDAVASAADVVGVDVPRSEERADDRGPATDDPSSDERAPEATTPNEPGSPGDGAGDGAAEPQGPPDDSSAGGNPTPGAPPEHSNAGGGTTPGTTPEHSNAGGGGARPDPAGPPGTTPAPGTPPASTPAPNPGRPGTTPAPGNPGVTGEPGTPPGQSTAGGNERGSGNSSSASPGPEVTHRQSDDRSSGGPTDPGARPTEG